MSAPKAPSRTRALSAAALAATLLLCACGDEEKKPQGAPAEGRPAKSSAQTPRRGSTWVGTWTLDPDAVYQVMLTETKADLAAEGQEADELDAGMLEMVKKSAAGSTRTLTLEADGTFTTVIGRDVPGEQYTERRAGTWQEREDGLLLTATSINGDESGPPEKEVVQTKDGHLLVEYHGHVLPMKRQ